MRLYIDMIAFYLQKAGGITVVWKELITRMLRDNLDVVLILQRTKCENIYFSQIMEYNPNTIYERYNDIRINRYMPVQCYFKENSVFISTYYRYAVGNGVKQCTLVHDFTYEYYVKGIKKLVHKMQKKFSIKHSDIIFCVSENTKKDLMQFYVWAKYKEIYVIYNGVSDVYRRVEKKRKIKELGRFNSESYFIFVGSRAAYKRFDFAVDVAAEYGYGLVIVGGGKLTRAEEKELQNKLNDRYLQLLEISDQELNLIYNKAFALLYPSEYEGFGIPIIEAQKAGCPIIAKEGSSISEIVLDRQMLMQKYDVKEVERIIKRYQEEETLLQEGYRNAERFSWEKTYQRYKEKIFDG